MDLLNERFQKSVNPNTFEMYYETKTKNEIKELYGGEKNFRRTKTKRLKQFFINTSK